MKYCIQCKGIDLRDAEATVDIHVPTAGGEMEVQVSGVADTRCATCGESYLKGTDLERADLIAAGEALRRGLREGPTLKFARKSLGFGTAELGDLLEVPVGAVLQWEDGRRGAERSVCNTLADLILDELGGTTTTLDRLRSLGVPRQAGETPGRVLMTLAGAQ